MLSDAKATIAVTGASGHLGSSLVQMLADQGYIILALYNSFAPQIQHSNIQWIKGNITNHQDLKQLLKDCRAVIHAAGVISIEDKEIQQLEHVNVQGTSAVIQACLRHKDIRMIHVSSSNAVLPPLNHDEIFDEQRPFNDQGTLYAQSKVKAERLVLHAINNDHLDAVIMRPSALIGPPDYKPSLMGQSIIDFYAGKYKIIPSGGYNCVDVRDASQSIINSIDHGQSGSIYNVTGHYQSLKNITDTLSIITGSKKPRLVIPINWLFPLVPLMRLISIIQGQPQKMTRSSLSTLKYGPRNMNHDKAHADLGHDPRPIKASISDLIGWFRQQNMIE